MIFHLKKENIKLNYQPIVISFEDLKVELYQAIAKTAFHCFFKLESLHRSLSWEI